MKRMLIVLSLAVVLVVAGASSAYALHHGYDATSGNCRSCHAVHGATGDHLYNSAASRGAAAGSVYAGQQITLDAGSIAQDLCEWCHVYGTTYAVYQSGMTSAETPAGKFAMGMHEMGAASIPDVGDSTFDLAKNATGLDCIDCHNAMPHAANANAAVAFYVQDAGATQVEVVNAMCTRCHEGNNSATHAGETHPLVTASAGYETDNYGTQVIAFEDSADCLACHNTAAGVHAAYADVEVGGALKAGNPVNTILPANNTGWKFTSGGVASARNVTYVTPQAGAQFAPDLTASTQKVTDGQCVACHVNADSSAGVGITY